METSAAMGASGQRRQQQQQQQQVVGSSVPSSGVISSSSKRKWKGKGFRSNQWYRKKNITRPGQGGYVHHQEYDPPRLGELRWQNRLKTRKYFREKKRSSSVPMTVPRAPFNDSSYLMRVRQPEGSSAALLSSSPPAAATSLSSLLATPSYSPVTSDREGMVEPLTEIGVGNRYGSMTGLIHLRPTDDQRSSSSTIDNNELDDMSSDDPAAAVHESSAESARQLEQRLDRDVSRFEMTYPLPQKTPEELLEERAARQDSHIAELEDENLTLRERLFLMQQEVYELRQRIQGEFHGDIDQLADACSDHCSLD
jgi:hypothetical protein